VTVVVWIFALIAAALHIVVFACEAFLIERPSVHEGVFGLPYVPAVRIWAFGVGFYNLFLGCGLIAGVIAWMNGNETIGRTLVIYICLFMVLSGIALHWRPAGFGWRPRQDIGGALGESLPRWSRFAALL
jgi:putative membrane protein